MLDCAGIEAVAGGIAGGVVAAWVTGSALPEHEKCRRKSSSPRRRGTQASFYGGLTVTLPWPLFIEDSSIPRGGEFLDSRLRGNDGVRCDGLCIE